MKDYQPQMSFDETTVQSYDEMAVRGDEDATVDFLAKLARGGHALELAIGTGRIALPLAARGIRVDGIDFSPAMVERLRAKPGGEEIEITLGTFAEVPVDGSYRLIYVIFNTLFNLLTQEEQVHCFQNVALHLEEGGHFVVEAGTPAEWHGLRNHQYVDLEGLEVGKVRLDVARYDPVSQRLEETHVVLTESGIQLNPIVMRYAWPAELDLMARLAGLRLLERWSGWARQPFTADSKNCISVYGR
jgi:SAM-dependent methyltransferase